MALVARPHAGFPGSLAVEQLNDLVYVVDRQLRFLYVNETTCRILGYSREDWFKVINDRWGHDAGDAVLVATAQRLQSVVREADTVARFRGDEFVIVVGEQCCAATLDAMMEKVTTAITEPVIWKGAALRIGASVGLARYPEDGVDAHSLLQHADESMYSEKARRQSKTGRYG